MHLRSSLAIHMRTCEEKSLVTKYDCKYCHQYFPLSQLNIHQPKCPVRPLRDDYDDNINNNYTIGWKSMNTNNIHASSYRPISPVRYTTGGLSTMTTNSTLNHANDSSSYALPILGSSSSLSTSTPNSSNGLVACRLCHRTFAPNRLITHESACRKAHRSRPIFDTQSQRINGIMEQLGETLNYNAKSTSRTKRPYSSFALSSHYNNSNMKTTRSPTSWRQQHEELISSIREAKRYLQHKHNPLRSYESNSYFSSMNKPTTPKIDNRVPCPYCDRSYAADTAEKHIPICAKTINRPRPPTSSVSPSRNRLMGDYHTNNSIRPSTVAFSPSRTSTLSPSLITNPKSSNSNSNKFSTYSNEITSNRPSGDSPHRPSSSSLSSTKRNTLPMLTTYPSSSSPNSLTRPSTVAYSSNHYSSNNHRFYASTLPISSSGCRDTILQPDLTRYNNNNDNNSFNYSSNNSPSRIKLGYHVGNTSSSLTNNTIINSNITSLNNPLAIRFYNY